MRVIFGLHLDGPVHPDPLDGCGALSGEVVTGPLGLLSLLETQLGLQGARESETVRQVQYARRLRSVDAPARFFHASLGVDELGVAATLLSWRDSLILCGWNGRAGAEAPPRLHDLAAVEDVTGEPLADGQGERARALLSALATRRSAVSELRIADRREDLPSPWIDILAALEARGVVIARVERPRAAARGDLGRLQASLLDRAHATAEADGSLILLQARSESEAAEALAERFKGATDGFVIVHAGDDDSLDRALRAQGLPIGGVAPCRWGRPALQALPLALALQWKPLDPYRLLEFLLLPIGPIPRSAAGLLASAVREEPGIGGGEWMRALAEAERRTRERARQEPGATDSTVEGAAKDMHGRIAAWLDRRRHDPVEGMPLDQALETAGRVASWAMGRAGTRDGDPTLLAAARQAGELSRVLQHHAPRRVRRLEIESLLQAVAGDGVESPGIRREAGGVPLVRHPSALLAPADTVIWWNFTAEGSAAPSRKPWSRSEREWLRGRGVRIEGPGVAPLRDAEDQLVPIRCAARRLVLVVPERVGGEVVAPHPLMARVHSVFDEGVRALQVRAEGLLARPVSFLGADLAPAPVVERSMMAPRRWWTLADVRLDRAPNKDGRPRPESPSSLEEFVHHPFLWVLKYVALLQPGALGGLPDENRLLGTLAHALVGEVVTNDDVRTAGTPEAIRAAIDARFDALLEQQGAILLLPGREALRHNLKDWSNKTATVVLAAMREGNWEGVRAEQRVEGAFAGGALAGFIDLLLEGPAGRCAILDMKRAYMGTFAKLLEENRALQLLLYAHMKRVGGQLPPVGYVILEKAQVLSADRAAFPNAVEVVARGGGLEDLWRAFEIAWRWRRGQLDQGRVEVTVAGTDEADAEAPPEGAIEPEGEPRFADEYARLTGAAAKSGDARGRGGRG